MEGAQHIDLTDASGLVRDALRGDEQFAVTGATGWLGRVALDVLEAALGPAFPTSVHGYASSDRQVETTTGTAVRVRPLAELLDQQPSPTHVLHYAFLTRDRVRELGVPEYVSANVGITALVVDAVERHRPRGLVVASSGAVHSHRSRSPDLPADPYGTLKRLDELTFQAAAASAGTTYVVPRIFNIAGAHMSKTDRFALGDFVIAARAGGTLAVRSPGQVLRAYVGADEVVAVSTALALRGKSATFDTGGHLIEVGDLARLVARLHGLPASSVSRPAPRGEPADEYVGDPTRWDELIADLGLRSQTLDDLIVATARSLDNPAGSGIVPLGSDPALPAKIQESTP